MEIPQRLESCNAGLVLVTHENSHEPWLHFEAGALSKHIDESRVVPLLCGATVGDIQGTPLSLFQAKALIHDDFLSICLSFGVVFEIPEDTVRRRFEKSWPELEQAVARVRGADQPKRQLGLPDLMAVLERVAAQVAVIENAVRLESSPYGLRPGMFGGRLPGTLGELVARTEASLPSETIRGLAQVLDRQSEAHDAVSKLAGATQSSPPPKNRGKR
jgi:hypothetical protein